MGIAKVGDRNKLEVRREPHWHKLASGEHLGFRKTEDGGHWIARAYDPATQKRVYHSLGDFRTLPDNERFDAASRAARSWLQHIAAGGQTTPITVGDAWRRYIAKCRPAVAEDAARRFRQHVEGDPIERVRLDQLKHVHLEEWRKRLADRPGTQPKRGPRCRVKADQPPAKPKAPSTINRDMVPMRAALNMAHRDGFVLTDRAWLTALEPIKNADGRRTLYIDAGARRELIAALPADLAAFVSALAQLPIRPGALAALTVSDFNSRDGMLKVRIDKAGAGRTVPLPDYLLPLFRRMAKSKLPAAPLFARSNGEAWTKDAWKKPIGFAAAKAKVPGVTAYTLRHCAITDLVQARYPLLNIAQLAGTSVAMIEKHYGHLLADDARAALAVLAL